MKLNRVGQHQHTHPRKAQKGTEDTYKSQLGSTGKRWGGSATGRAVEPVANKKTSDENKTRVDALKQGREYKEGTLRVHFKGTRDDGGSTSGMPLTGQSTERTNWPDDLNTVRNNLSEKFAKRGDKPGTNGSTKLWYAENAHVRAQSVGGVCDELGTQPASYHSNTEDMAREKGENELDKKMNKKKDDDNVRMKMTSYVHKKKGNDKATVKAHRTKYYMQDDASREWRKVADILQDGHRSNIDKVEAREMKARITNLDESKNQSKFTSAKGIRSGSDIDEQKKFQPTRLTKSHESPYFTDLVEKKNGSKIQYTGQGAATRMEELFRSAADAIRKAAADAIREEAEDARWPFRNMHGDMFEPTRPARQGKPRIKF